MFSAVFPATHRSVMDQQALTQALDVAFRWQQGLNREGNVRVARWTIDEIDNALTMKTTKERAWSLLARGVGTTYAVAAVWGYASGNWWPFWALIPFHLAVFGYTIRHWLHWQYHNPDYRFTLRGHIAKLLVSWWYEFPTFWRAAVAKHLGRSDIAQWYRAKRLHEDIELAHGLTPEIKHEAEHLYGLFDTAWRDLVTLNPELSPEIDVTDCIKYVTEELRKLPWHGGSHFSSLENLDRALKSARFIKRNQWKEWGSSKRLYAVVSIHEQIDGIRKGIDAPAEMIRVGQFVLLLLYPLLLVSWFFSPPDVSSVAGNFHLARSLLAPLLVYVGMLFGSHVKIHLPHNLRYPFAAMTAGATTTKDISTELAVLDLFLKAPFKRLKGRDIRTSLDLPAKKTGYVLRRLAELHWIRRNLEIRSLGGREYVYQLKPEIQQKMGGDSARADFLAKAATALRSESLRPLYRHATIPEDELKRLHELGSASIAPEEDVELARTPLSMRAKKELSRAGLTTLSQLRGLLLSPAERDRYLWVHGISKKTFQAVEAISPLETQDSVLPADASQPSRYDPIPVTAKKTFDDLLETLLSKTIGEVFMLENDVDFSKWGESVTSQSILWDVRAQLISNRRGVFERALYGFALIDAVVAATHGIRVSHIPYDKVDLRSLRQRLDFHKKRSLPKDDDTSERLALVLAVNVPPSYDSKTFTLFFTKQGILMGEPDKDYDLSDRHEPDAPGSLFPDWEFYTRWLAPFVELALVVAFACYLPDAEDFSFVATPLVAAFVAATSLVLLHIFFFLASSSPSEWVNGYKNVMRNGAITSYTSGAVSAIGLLLGFLHPISLILAVAQIAHHYSVNWQYLKENAEPAAKPLRQSHPSGTIFIRGEQSFESLRQELLAEPVGKVLASVQGVHINELGEGIDSDMSVREASLILRRRRILLALFERALHEKALIEAAALATQGVHSTGLSRADMALLTEVLGAYKHISPASLSFFPLASSLPPLKNIKGLYVSPSSRVESYLLYQSEDQWLVAEPYPRPGNSRIPWGKAGKLIAFLSLPLIFGAWSGENDSSVMTMGLVAAFTTVTLLLSAQRHRWGWRKPISQRPKPKTGQRRLVLFEAAA